MPKRAERRVLPDGGGGPAARLPGVQALPARRLTGLAGVGRPRRRRGPRRCASSPTASSTARACPASPAASATASATSTGVMTDELGAGPARHRPGPARPHRPHAARDDGPAPRRRRRGRRVRQRAPVQRHRPRGVRVDADRRCAHRRRARTPSTGRRPSSSSCPCASRSPPTSCWRSSPPAPSRASSTGTAPRTTVRSPAAGPRRRRARAPAPDRRTRRHVAAPRCSSPTGATSAPPCAASGGSSTSTPTRSSVDDALAADAGARRRRSPPRPACACPGSVDPFETAVGRSIGQQISVAGARTVAGRIVAAVGDPLTIDGGPRHPRVPGRPRRWPTSIPALLPMPRQPPAHDRRARPARRRRRARARRRCRPRRTCARGAARRARHRAVDGGLRADARPRRPRRVPADRPRRQGRPRRRSASTPTRADALATVALVRPPPPVVGRPARRSSRPVQGG